MSGALTVAEALAILGESAAAGGEGGALGGPLGVAVGIGIGLAVGGIILLAKEHADATHSDVQPGTVAECPDKAVEQADELPCFNTPENGDPDEMRRQLQEQQDAINKMSPDEVLKNLDRFDLEGRPDDSAARRKAREFAQTQLEQELIEEHIAAGDTPEVAQAKAAAEAAEEMAAMDATHTLDWVAGGDGTISGMGSSKENRSIGSQWKGRRDALRKAAEAAKQTGNSKMNVKLVPC